MLRLGGFASSLGLVASFSVVVAGGVFEAVPQAKKQAPKAPSTIAFEKDVRPILTKFCVNCHTGKAAAAGIDLSSAKTVAAVVAKPDVWDRVARNVQTKTMPPAGMPSPSTAQRQKFVAWIENTLRESCDVADPGRVTMRRLNKAEYVNTVRDLVGVDFKAAEDFPSDDVGHGFDNIGDVLTISPLLAEKYLDAAEKISEVAIVVPEPKVKRYEAENMSLAQGANEADSSSERLLYGQGFVATDVTVQQAGRYRFRAMAWGQQAGPDPVRMSFQVDGKTVATVDVPNREPKLYEVPVELARGKRRIGVAFINDYYKPEDPNPRNRDRNMLVDWLELDGPDGGVVSLPASHKRILFLTPTPQNHKETARKMLAAFATRAYRRPATADEVDRLMSLYALTEKNKEPFERRIQVCVQAVLVSPHFLFRVEADPAANKAATRSLNGYELASRLSYFLWSSMPDDRLTDLAKTGELKDPKVLSAEVDRMLKSPKATALADNFAEQWLQLRMLASAQPDPTVYPSYDPALRQAMMGETKGYFNAIVREDRSVLEFIDSSWTMLNDRMAKHYGIEGVTGPEFRKVKLGDRRRGGLLGHASILTITSNPTRTSPTKRGKWVLEQILGTPPPPPPPGVGDLKEEEGKPLSGKTLRERLEQHRKKAECAVCHTKMDTLGFGLENYDGVGAWRTGDSDGPIDVAGKLPDGKAFKTPGELRQILMADKGQFVEALGDRMLTYALGRGLTSTDKCVTEQVAKGIAKGGYKFSGVVKAVVLSEPFRMRKTLPVGKK